jgi:hypothetical protein
MHALDKITAAALCALAVCASPLANAKLVSVDANTFKDDTTGYVWRTLNQYDGLTFTAAAALLPTGFHVASEAELATLTAAAPANSSTFAADAAIMGLSANYSILWGFYGNGSSYVWREDWNDDFWTANGANTSGWYNFGEVIPAGYQSAGLSLFAVDTTPPSSNVPEPATLALVGLGLAGLQLRRRAR